MSPKLVAIFSVLFVAAQAGEPRLGYNMPSLGLGNARVIGGQEARPGEFPHQVSLQWGMPPMAPFQHFCGGTIINSQWILTAGHCVFGVPNYGSFIVKAGKHNLLIRETNEQTVKVSGTIVHKKYVGNVAPYDIALLKLETPLTLNEAVNVISLPKLGAKQTGYSILSGWGSVTPNGKTQPAKLQKIALPLVDLETCKSKYVELTTTSEPLDETNICTGSRNFVDASCSGDSGGPLIRRNANGVKEVIGVVSWGIKPCGANGAPSVYADVAHFVDWIQNAIEQNS